MKILVTNNNRGEVMKKLIALVLMGGFATAGLSAEMQLAWPQFRGPNDLGLNP